MIWSVNALTPPWYRELGLITPLDGRHDLT